MITANRYFRPLLWPTIATLAAMIVLIGLGVWQLERLQWKLALIEKIEERISAPPAELPAEAEWTTLDPSVLEYRRFHIAGKFLNDKELYYFSRNDKGDAGYNVITPLRLASGAIILVDRGFVPEELRLPAARPQSEIENTVDMIGVARAPQSKNSFTPVDDVERNIWFTRDPASMAEALKLARVAPFFIEADATPNPGGWPKGGQTQVNIRNEHLQYALTWFGLAATLLAVYLAFHWKSGRIGRIRYE